MANPHTAAGKASVFSRVGRDNFERSVRKIESDTFIPSATSTGIARPCDDSSVIFSVLDEEHLANDLAFIARARSGRHEIRAAALQMLTRPDRLIITLASNECVPNDVERAFRKLCQTLRTCAGRASSRKICENALLTVVLTLNEEKLRDRLWCNVGLDAQGQKKYPRGSWLTSAFDDQVANNLPADQTVRDRFSAQLCVLSDLLATFKASTAGAAEPAKAVAIAVSNLYSIDERVIRYLEEAERPSNVQERAHQIRQIARYVGVCRRLSRLCREHSTYFINTHLDVVPEFCKRLSVSGTPRMKLLVHAEIALLTHLELKKNKPHPRVIGSSKAACFLCNSFIRAYGGYYLTATHGTFYQRWTVPDLLGFNQMMRNRFAEALLRVNGDIIEAVKAPNKRQLHASERMLQSVRDLTLRILSPFASSIASGNRSSASVESQATVKALDQPNQAGLARVQPDQRDVAQLGLTSEDLRAIASPVCRVPDASTTAMRTNSQPGKRARFDSTLYPCIKVDPPSTPELKPTEYDNEYEFPSWNRKVHSNRHSCMVKAGEATRIVCDRIELFVHLEPPVVADQPTSAEVIASSSAASEDDHAVVNIAELPDEEPGLVLVRSDSDKRDGVAIVLQGSRTDTRILVRCRWPHGRALQ